MVPYTRVLTLRSGRPELHHRHSHLFGCRNASDLGILWFAVPSAYLLAIANTSSEYKNRHGSNIGAKVFLIVVAMLNAVRSSFSFFLLLIVCMGYGVVKPTLGRTMIYIRWLAAAHFLFGLVYAIADHIVAPEDAGKSLKTSLL
jgi:hypothetical protein